MSAPARRAAAVEVGTLVRLAGARVAARLGRRDATEGVVVLLLDGTGRLLSAKTRYRPGWGVPGGFCDPGEDPLAAAARELAEETGLAGVTLHYGGVVDGPMAAHRTHYAAGIIEEPPATLRPPRPLEIAGLCWHRPGEPIEWQRAMRLWFAGAQPVLWAEAGRWRVRGLAGGDCGGSH